MTEFKNGVDQKLKQYIEKIETLEEQKSELAHEISSIYKEAVGVGFDAKTMRKIVSLRKLDQDERTELEQLIETYKEALGMS